MQKILSAKNISKSFDSSKVLDSVDLLINQGEIIVITGSSGAGKTTLLNILGTIETPDFKDKSSLKICNTDIFKLDDRELSKFRNKNIGFVFQFHELLPEFTCLENVCLPGWIDNSKNISEIEDRAMSLFEILGLEDKVKMKPATLSGGEKQRVSIARSLINNPEIILADEPTANLDTITGREIIDLIKELNQDKDVTVISATHDLKMLDVSDRIVDIRDGLVERIRNRDEIDIEVGEVGGH
mgnify:CR=1 FL=1